MEESKVYKAKSIQELQHILKTIKDAVPVAGGTIFSSNNDENEITMAKHIIALNSIPQLHQLHKTDRYI